MENKLGTSLLEDVVSAFIEMLDDRINNEIFNWFRSNIQYKQPNKIIRKK